MKTIRLENMQLRNFKGVENQAYAFNERTAITGANGTGKSTIFDAYLWCLFDKTQYGEKPKVQPLDADNQIIHNLTTEVVLTLVVDGNQMKVARRMTEKKDGGTESKYFVNDVPMTQTQFRTKMSEIGDLDRWFTISSINIIPAMEQKVCRAALQDIAPAFDEMLLAKNYTDVEEAFKCGLTIDELAQRMKSDRTKAKAELDSIPAAMDAQDRLRVEDDFTGIGQRIDAINAEVVSLTAQIEEAKKVQVDSAAVAKEEERRKRMAEVSKTISDIENELYRKQTAAQTEYNNKVEEYDRTIRNAETDLRGYEARLESIKGQMERYDADVKALRERWMKKNAEEFTANDTCPTCGQPLPAERIEAARTRWFEEKTAALAKINEDGKATKATLERLQNEAEDIKENAEKRRTLISETKDALEQFKAGAQTIPSLNDLLSEDAAYQEAKALYDALMEEMKSEAEAHKGDEAAVAAKVQPLKDKMASLMDERRQLETRMAAKATNERIDAERKRLEEQQEKLTQAIAEYESIEAQIAAFRKAKIETVENGVSSLFTMVRWKMYEPNVTNDGEREICTPIVDGVPFAQQNTATQYNAALDIVNGFAKAYGVSVPLFIDGAESVTDLIKTDNQLITLAVKPNSALNIE